MGVAKTHRQVTQPITQDASGSQLSSYKTLSNVTSATAQTVTITNSNVYVITATQPMYWEITQTPATGETATITDATSSSPIFPSQNTFVAYFNKGQKISFIAQSSTGDVFLLPSEL